MSAFAPADAVTRQVPDLARGAVKTPAPVTVAAGGVIGHRVRNALPGRSKTEATNRVVSPGLLAAMSGRASPADPARGDDHLRGIREPAALAAMTR